MKSKICTTIEQSQKLIELGIDRNTADMCWQNNEFPIGFNDDDAIPAWSLAALMDMLPSKFIEKGKYSETTYSIHIRKYALTEDVDLYQIAYGNYKFYEDGNSSWKDMINTGQKEELIDAAFEMICWLKENNEL